MRLFQSAPATEIAGDLLGAHQEAQRRKFQSAPATEIAGDGRRAASVFTRLPFQSAPATEIAGDGAGGRRPRSGRSFNPHLRPKSQVTRAPTK